MHASKAAKLFCNDQKAIVFLYQFTKSAFLFCKGNGIAVYWMSWHPV